MKFGKDERIKDFRNDSPGPGTYEIKPEVDINKEKQKGSSMYFKHLPAKGDNFPGPGTYKTLFESQANVSDNMFTSQFHRTKNNFIGTESRFKKENQNPIGPGNYESQTIFAEREKGQRNIVWGKDQRFRPKNNLQPGPGQYNIKSKFNEIPPYVRDQIHFDPPTY